MLKKVEWILITAVVLTFSVGVAFAASKDKKPAGLVGKTVLIQEKYNTFDESKLKELGGKVDLTNFDQMVGFVVVEAKQDSGKLIQDHHTYRFNGSTDVRTNKKGGKISMKDLVVPCRAKINFFPNMHKAPILYSIEVIQTFGSGERSWSVPDQD